MAALIDHQVEEPDVEYKAWMDLSTPENRSKIAKHICAISNYGGGWIVFGVNDNGGADQDRPTELNGYNQDVLNGIVARYLEPELHCNVYFPKSGLTDQAHPVVRVPPHGAQPVCAKADGPLVEKRRVGVTKGVHYIRVAGPRSEPISEPEMWRPVIHRCVLAEREQLLGSIGRLFEKPSIVATPTAIADFLDNTIERWNSSQTEGWPVDPQQNRSALGFELLKSNSGPISQIKLSALKSSVRESSNIAEQECNGFPSFNLSYEGLVTPAVFLWDNIDGLESNAVVKDNEYLFAPAVSRVLINGLGAEVRTQHEDSLWVRDLVPQRSSRQWPVGTRFSPSFQASRVFGFVVFVRAIASAFPDAARVRLIVDYNGLTDRILAETRGYTFLGPEKKSSTDHRRVQIETTIESLAGDGAIDTAISLLNPIFRLFDGWEMKKEYFVQAIKQLG